MSQQLAAGGRQLGFGHRAHPWLGRRVVDKEHHGRIGVLRAVAPDVDDIRTEPLIPLPGTPPVAWLSPVRGGCEWTTSLSAIEVVAR
ncbi:hypothetical protein ACXZ65_22705 [Streptomyces aculeolatus]